MKTATKPKVGDRILYLGRVHGTLIAIKKGRLKYEIAWDSGRSEHYSQSEWNKGDFELCSGSSTSVVASAQVSPLPDYSLDSPSVDSARLMSTAEISYQSDTQTPQSTATLEGLQLVIPAVEFTSLQPVPLANPSRSKGSAKEQTINVTVSPPCVKRSPHLDLNTSALKTSLDFLAAPIPQESKDPISTGFYRKFPTAGMMQSGLWLVQDSLAVPGADKDCSFLESPGALSSTPSSRSPGQSRLEAQLKKLGVIQKGECLDPEWLEKKFHLPRRWSDPSESRPATQLLEIDEPPSETVLTPELLLSPCEEFSISIPCKLSKKRSQNLVPPSGSLSACTTIKKGKPYVSYQYSYDVRDPDTKRGWRTVKVGVPRHKKQAIANLINQGMPVTEILAALKG